MTAISALSRLTINSPTVFQHVIEKAGFKAVSTALASSIPKIQQGLVTMFVVLLSNRPQMRRLVQERDLATKGLHVSESIHGYPGKGLPSGPNPDPVQPGSPPHVLPVPAGHVHRAAAKERYPIKGESRENRDYLVQCQNICMSAIVEAVPGILLDVLASLDAVQGRKHPSASHAKQLRTNLPLLSIILHLVTSHAFRSQATNEEFLVNVGLLLSHVTSIDSGSTSIGSAAGPNAAEDLISVVLSIAEAITQHPPILLEYHAVVTQHILPHLAALMSSTNGDTRVLSFRMFADVASLYLDNHNVYNSSSDVEDMLKSTSKLNEVRCSLFLRVFLHGRVLYCN